jgi:hypothetical protein
MGWFLTSVKSRFIQREVTPFSTFLDVNQEMGVFRNIRYALSKTMHPHNKVLDNGPENRAFGYDNNKNDAKLLL